MDDRTSELIGDFGQIDVRLDIERERRCGQPEVIFAQGKTAQQVARIGAELYQKAHLVLATRISAEQFNALREAVPCAQYYEQAHLAIARRSDSESSTLATGHIVVASAGTADVPVAEEAAITAELYGARVTRLYDIGVAGVHRALAHADTLRDSRVIIAVAGMEGALPTLIAGLVDVPVIAVPTSVGYGAHFEGIAPLLTMMNSCAGGIGVVNIDNGFGAAVLACRINDPSWFHKEECVQ